MQYSLQALFILIINDEKETYLETSSKRFIIDIMKRNESTQSAIRTPQITSKEVLSHNNDGTTVK